MELVKLIAEKLGRSENEVWRLIEEKRKELDYLISEEGASHIIASELGINVNPQFKASNLSDGASGIEIILRVLEVSPAREFERNGRKGKVRNLRVGDDSGEIGLSLWDDRADTAVKEKFEAAWDCKLSTSPGLTLTEIIPAAYEGKIKAIYLMGENPVLSDPDASHVEEALKNPDVQLAIRADEGSPFGRIVRVMDAAKAAGIKTVSAFTRKAGER